MKERIAIIGGLRTPMIRAGGSFKNIQADELGAKVTQEILIRNNIDPSLIDEVIFGNVAQPGHAANIARVIALKSSIPNDVPAFTVHRNCASGMESITNATSKILNNEAQIIIAGGVESMSNIPLLFNKKMTNFFEKLFRARTVAARIKTILSFRLSFLKPIIGIQQGLTDPISGMIMGCTAEVLAKEFSINREEQDKFALKSHKKAENAINKNIFDEEILPIYDQNQQKMIEKDDGVREGQTIEALAKLKPYFEKKTGTVTVGNSSQLTDAAAAVILMKESKAKELGLEVDGYLREFAYAGLEPERMGLGPVYATSKLFDKANLTMTDIDLVEINEAFAAQALACQKAFASKDFAKKYLNKSEKIGIIKDSILNVNGGAIALGHPVGMTGTRLVIHMLKELKRRKKNRGLATLCIGGGQGAALVLETS